MYKTATCLTQTTASIFTPKYLINVHEPMAIRLGFYPFNADISI